jgi:hypothetical protein
VAVAVVEQAPREAQIIGEYLVVMQAQTVQVQAVDKYHKLREQTAVTVVTEFQVAVVECVIHRAHKQIQQATAVQV